MNQALKLFTAVPRLHNCAQAVASGIGRDDLTPQLVAMGGGRAPEGRCGAVFAAMLAVPEDKREALLTEFSAKLGHSRCRELKAALVPCSACVETAAELAVSCLSGSHSKNCE